MAGPLYGKVALIYGAGGIGRTIAAAYAKAGARVVLASRSEVHLKEAKRSKSIETVVLDATDADAVKAHVDAAVRAHGRIDISFNVIGLGDVQKKLLTLSPDDFVAPIETAMRSQFLTTSAAVRHMAKRKSGVVLFFGGGGIQTAAGIGGFKVALDALEGLRRQFAIEHGKDGVRFVTLKTGGVPDSISPRDDEREAIRKSIESGSPMGKSADLVDVGDVAVFAASDQARSLTDTWINIGFGAMPD